jgi:hypothetical protein
MKSITEVWRYNVRILLKYSPGLCCQGRAGNERPRWIMDNADAQRGFAGPSISNQPGGLLDLQRQQERGVLRLC